MAEINEQFLDKGAKKEEIQIYEEILPIIELKTEMEIMTKRYLPLEEIFLPRFLTK